MSTFVWYKLGSPTLQPSSIALRAYDGRAAQPQVVLMNVLVQLARKTMLIDIEVVNSQHDYNLLLGHSYMYGMRVVASIVFRLLMFPHDGKIVTIKKLTYYDPKGMATLKQVLPTINTAIHSVSIPSLSVIGSGFFSNAPMKDTYLSLPPLP